METWIPWIPVIVSTIALTGIAATVTVQWRAFNRQALSTHRLKMAELRQAWINDLRLAMCEFQSYGVTPDLDQTKQREFYAAGTRVELLMNPKDPDYEALRDTMDVYLSAKSVDEKFMANSPLIQVCQRIIKREWERLKLEARPPQ